MIQIFTPSCLTSSLPRPQREKGIQTRLQSQRRHTKILYRDKEIECRRLSSHNILDSTESFSSCCDKPKRNQNLLIQTFGTTSNDDSVLQPKEDGKIDSKSNLWNAFYRLFRIHTITGMVIAVSSVSLLPLTSVRDLSPAYFVGLLQALIPFVFVNMYVDAINQLFDVEVDKVNKPYYPLVSGECSMGQVIAAVFASGFMCLATGMMFRSPPLFIGVLVYFLLGTAYSVELPFLRWKTNPFLAAICIVGGHGLTIQPAVFYHIQHVLGKPLALTKSVGFATIFISLFSVVLALFKDIPDVEGDKAFGNQTFSVRHGKKKVFTLCVGILLIVYGSAVVIGASSSFLICKLVSVIGHCTLATVFLLQAKSLNLDDDVSTKSFYKLLWKSTCLFISYAEKIEELLEINKSKGCNFLRKRTYGF